MSEAPLWQESTRVASPRTTRRVAALRTEQGPGEGCRSRLTERSSTPDDFEMSVRCPSCGAVLEPGAPDCPACCRFVPEDERPAKELGRVRRRLRLPIPWGLLIVLAVYFGSVWAYVHVEYCDSPRSPAARPPHAAPP